MEACVQNLVPIAQEMEQESTPAPTNTAAPAGTEIKQLVGQLLQLASLLQQSDMQALEVHAGLSTLACTNPDMLHGLNEAMAAFNFNAAHKHCTALIAALTPPAQNA
jgi:hypothetical protein